MSDFYTRMRAKANELLTKFGRQVTFTRWGEVRDEVVGTVTASALTTQTLRAATLPASSGTLEAFDVRFMPDVADGRELRFMVCAAEGATFRPEPKDTVDFGDGVQWRVLGNTPLSVDGTDIIYSIGTEKA